MKTTNVSQKKYPTNVLDSLQGTYHATGIKRKWDQLSTNHSILLYDAASRMVVHTNDIMDLCVHGLVHFNMNKIDS